jgi:hypothetical protein
VEGDGLAIGDVNGDGNPDLISAGGYVAFGVGGGSFSKAANYPIVAEGLTVVLADLANNGLTDMVMVSYFGTSVLLNQGQGQFEDGIWTTVTDGSSCATTADFNGDGKPDLAVTTSAGISILLGTGKGTSPFSTGTPIVLANAACMVSGDLNGDGIPDLLVSVNGSPNALLTYLGNGDGTFTLKSTTFTPNSGGYVVLADFNHDGKLDFATSGNLLALGNGDGTFQTPTPFVANPPTGGYSGIAAGDLNSDGWPDLVLTNGIAVPYNEAVVLLNNQQGGFTLVPSKLNQIENAQQPVLADVNKDGKLDLIVGDVDGTGAYVYIGNGEGQFAFRVALSGAFGAVNSYNVVADVNGDGVPDILVLGFDTLGVYLGEGGAEYETPFFIGLGPDPVSVLVANLHGQTHSGLPDIVAPDGNAGVMTLLNLTK